MKRIALVGAGKWGSNFIRTIVGSQQDELTVIVSSKTKQQIDAIAINNAKIIPDISLIDEFSSEIDGAIVATPPDVRPAIVEKLLHLGIPVLSEKPLSLTTDTSVKLIQLARLSGVPLIEDYIHLFSWPYLKINEQRGASWPITINTIGGGWGPFRDYSPLLDYGPHDLAMVLQIFDRLPTNVHLEPGDYKSNLAFTANIKLDFSERGQASISISNVITEKVRKFQLIQGNIEWLYDDNSHFKLKRNDDVQASEIAGFSPMQLLLDHFCERKEFYSNEKLLWLSESVAEVLQILDTKFQSG